MAYVAAFPFKYCGDILLSGQVVRELRGAPGDFSLTSQQYLREIEDSALKEAIKCDDCGREFISTRHLHDHRRNELCLDENRKLLSSEATMAKAKDLRTDQSVIGALPESRRKELQGPQ